MKPNALRRKLERGEPALNGWCVLANAHAAEILAHQGGFDSITIDIQHGAMDIAEAFTMLQAMSAAPVTPLVRVPWNDPALIMKALDAGAEGIICPMINTADEARAFVAACRYPPAGNRSFGPTRAALAARASSSAAYAAAANGEVVCLAMIETVAGLAAIEEILDVEGLDGIYVGPGDLSLSLGASPSMRPWDPVVVEAIARCLACARKARRFSAIHTDGPETALLRFEQGFGLCTLSSDARLLADGARAQTASCRRAMD